MNNYIRRLISLYHLLPSYIQYIITMSLITTQFVWTSSSKYALQFINKNVSTNVEAIYTSFKIYQFIIASKTPFNESWFSLCLTYCGINMNHFIFNQDIVPVNISRVCFWKEIDFKILEKLSFILIKYLQKKHNFIIAVVF